jgi:uncharacterized membrane protein
MSNNKNNLVVVAIFDDQDAADSAIDDLKSWNNQSKAMKLGAIGTLNLEEGEIVSRIPRQIGKGAAIGVIAGTIAGILSGSIGILIGAAGGALAGGAVGSMFKKATNLRPEDMIRLKEELTDGKVAVMATVDEHEKENTSGKLKRYGGNVLTFTAP